MSLIIKLLQVSDFQQNCRIAYHPESKRAVLIDPGGDATKILNEIKSLGLNLEGVYLTHSHIDHCGAVAPILKELPVPLYGHAAEGMMRSGVVMVAQMYGLPAMSYFNCPEPNVYLEAGMEIDILGIKTKVIGTPGHSPGSLSFWMPSEALIFSGDVLFRDSIGRSDLPGGDHNILIASIGMLARILPPETKVLSGHGPDTSIERELMNNPFLQ